jgi:hypothetical protein
MTTNTVFTCIADPTKRLLEQSARLLMSIRWFGGSLAQARFVLGCTGPTPREALELFDHYGAEVVTVERYDPTHGHSNKIALLGSPILAGHDIVVLLDCDTVLVQDPAPWLDPRAVAAKLADLPTVSLTDLQAIFRHFKCAIPSPRYYHELTGDACIAYCNSGVIVVPEKYRSRLVSEWDYWNRLVLTSPETLRFNRFHADQVSLALALENSDVPFAPLPPEMNMPVHFETYPPAWHTRDPVIIHYHWLAYSSGFLKPVSLHQCSRRIEAFNARLRAERHSDSAVSFTTSNPPQLKPSSANTVTTPKVLVGSGWWCADSSHDWTIGSPATRSVAFFDVWYRQLVRCLNPERIVVTDSASPVKPDYCSYPALRWIELDRNYGHANDLRTGRIQAKYSGFTRAVINGAMYALCCDADFYVYVEQDCLLQGEDFLTHALGDSTEDILIGRVTENGRGLGGAAAAPMPQQSLLIVRKTGLDRFITGIIGAPWTDGERSPEQTMQDRLAPVGFVRVPYGRSRPIDFERSHFYAQHLDDDELHRFLELINTSLTPRAFAFSVGKSRAEQLPRPAARTSVPATRGK